MSEFLGFQGEIEIVGEKLMIGGYTLHFGYAILQNASASNIYSCDVTIGDF